MKKLNRLVTLATILLFLVNSNSSLIVNASEKIYFSDKAPIKESDSTAESAAESSDDSFSDSIEMSEMTSSTYETTMNSETIYDMKERAEEDSSSTIESSDKMLKTELVREDAYWLVDTATQLRTYLSEGKKLFRLTKNIDLAQSGFKLSDGVVIDGNGYKITYSKAGSYNTGFYLEENNATVTIKNAVIGNTDGSGSVGYYGIVTGNSTYSNMTIIYDGISYYSDSGQPLYNPNGAIILRGNNQFIQTGRGLYAQEWAETNYIEIESGRTTVNHDAYSIDGLIYSYSTNSNNPHKNTTQIVVRKDASFDVTTNRAFIYSSASFDQNITVEENGYLSVKQTDVSNATRKRFIYPNLNNNSTVTFDFQKNSAVNLSLQLPIQIKDAKGSFTVNENAKLDMTIASGPMFDLSSNSQFNLKLLDPKKVDFSGTTQGTLGLLANSTAFENVSLLASNRMKVESYSNSSVKLGTFDTTETRLNANGADYRNLGGEQLSSTNLKLLGSSYRLVFESILVPKILSTEVEDRTGNSAKLSVTSENFESPAKEVKYLLFSSLEDTGTLEKAKHIENVTDFKGLDTSHVFAYGYQVKGLNPNTNYWYQAMVTNQNGRSSFSTPVAFSTLPTLEHIHVREIRDRSANISGVLASDTGVWTDFSNGEESPILNNPVDYGGVYQTIAIDYSENNQFTTYESVTPTATGNKNEKFSYELSGLTPETTYYVRVRATGVSGEEIVLTELPITQFTTGIEEIIDVEIPIEMAFQTKNKDLETVEAGQIYSQSDEYQVVNKGTVPVQVMVSNLNKKNEDADSIQLVSDDNGQFGEDSLNLKLFGVGKTSYETDLTESVGDNPVLIGDLNTTDQKEFQLDFGGKFFNPLSPMLTPKYLMTLKFEQVK